MAVNSTAEAVTLSGSTFGAPTHYQSYSSTSPSQFSTDGGGPFTDTLILGGVGGGDRFWIGTSDYFYLENAEDGLVDTTGLTSSEPVSGPGLGFDSFPCYCLGRVWIAASGGTRPSPHPRAGAILFGPIIAGSVLGQIRCVDGDPTRTPIIPGTENGGTPDGRSAKDGAVGSERSICAKEAAACRRMEKRSTASGDT